MVNKFRIEEELQMGGDWLGAAHEWMQWNLKNGSTVQWGSHEEVRLTVHDLEQFALTVAVAAIGQERNRAASNNKSEPTQDDYIDWAKVPEEINAVVINENKEVYWLYIEDNDPSPKSDDKGDGYWVLCYSDKSRVMRYTKVPDDAIIGPLPPWRESLRRRPGSAR